MTPLQKWVFSITVRILFLTVKDPNYYKSSQFAIYKISNGRSNPFSG